MNFYLSLGALVALYACAGLGAAFQRTRLGVISLAHGAIMGTAAYVYAVGAHAGLPILGAMLLGAAGGAACGAAIGLASGRLAADRFALGTFALQVVWSALAQNLRGVTGGALGIAGVPPIVTIDRIPAGATSLLFAGGALALAGTYVLYQRCRAFDVACQVVERSDELGWSLGLRPWLVRAQVGALAGGAAGLSGVGLAAHLSFIDPTLFGIDCSVLVVATGLFGARRSEWRVLPGALILVGLPDLLRLAGLPSSRSAYLRFVLEGAVVCAWALHALKRRSRAVGG